MYEYKAQLVRVIDGDTVELDIDLGLHVRTRSICRLHGINAPETRGEEKERGEAAKRHLAVLLGRINEGLRIRTIRDKQGKYGRWLVNILAVVDGMVIDVNQRMIEDGHAVKADY